MSFTSQAIAQAVGFSVRKKALLSNATRGALIAGMMVSPLMLSATPPQEAAEANKNNANKPLVLAQGGKALATIVVADKPDLTAIRGWVKGENVGIDVGDWARVLADRLKEATGADFPVVSESKAPKEGHLILVGTSALSRKYGFDGLKGMKPEEARIVTFSRGLALFGHRMPANMTGAMGISKKDLRGPKTTYPKGTIADKGTGHAVTIFLEKFTGYRFYYPWKKTNLWMHIPKVDRLEVPANTDWREHPVFIHRQGITRSFKDEKLPMKFLAFKLGASVDFAVNHVEVILPRDFPNHKDQMELFAKKKDGSPWVDRYKQQVPCYASERHVDVYLDHVRHFDKTGEMKYRLKGGHGNRAISKPNYVLVGTPDKMWRDYDPRSLALYDESRDPIGSQSDLVGTFIARLARKVSKEWPGRRVMYLGHNNCAAAPSDRVPYPDNVYVLTAMARYAVPYMSQKIYRDLNDRFIDRWHEKLGRDRTRISIWDYPSRPQHYTGVKIPVYCPNVVKRFLSRNREKISGEYLNPTHNSMYIALPLEAIWGDLLWNPDLDVEAWYDEFCRLMFGPAGKPMRELIALCIRRWEETQWVDKIAPGGGPNARPSEKIQFEKIFPKEEVARAKALFQKARELVAKDPNPAYAERMDFLYNEGGDLGFHAFFTASHVYFNPRTSPPIFAVGLKSGQGPEIDGKLNETCWAAARKYALLEGDDPKLLRPGSPEWASHFRFAFDPSALYLALEFDHKINPGKAKAERISQIRMDNHLQFSMAPGKKKSKGFDFVINYADFCTVEGITSKTRMDKQTHRVTMEIRIPWKTLGLNGKDLPEKLLINLYRKSNKTLRRHHGTLDQSYAVNSKQRAELRLGEE